jgi:hypothetical protein
MKEITAINHLNDRHYINPGNARQIMTNQQVKETLLYTENFILACGHSWKLKIKNIGVGMKEVTLVPF